jgi:hypothetical protein
MIFLLASGAVPRLAWFGFLGVIAVVIAFAFGMAMLLSVAAVRFRDIEPIWSVVLQVIFYTSGVFSRSTRSRARGTASCWSTCCSATPSRCCWPTRATSSWIPRGRRP